MKLGLGTVQFGLDYGISNKSGRVPQDQVHKIITSAQAQDIQVLDTAFLYGSSEEVLGNVLSSHNLNHDFTIVTKTPQFSSVLTKHDGQILEDSFLQSLMRLRMTKTYGLLIHQAQDLLKQDSQILWGKMLELRERNLVKKIGVSVYTKQELEEILKKFTPDLIQLPINVFDQTLCDLLPQLKQNNIEIHARSVFLQGLLLMELQDVPNYFDPIKSHIKQYKSYTKNYGLSGLQAALKFCHDLKHIDVALVGICSCDQLDQIVHAYNMLPQEQLDFSSFALTDEKIIKPSLWRLSL